jgi:L-fuculose-phosphate aldolase
MHLFCYKKRPDIGAIVHGHPPFSTGFAAAGLSLDKTVLPEALLILGKVPLVEYGTPSTKEVPQRLEPYVLSHNVFLLANHGALTLGRNLAEACHRMETLELFAKIITISRMLGGEKTLSKEEEEKLLGMFGKK